MEEMFGFLSVIVIGCGVYSLYAYIQMKKGGPINEALLLGRSYNEYKCKDKDAFLQKALPAVLVFAFASLLYGVVDFIHCYVQPIKTIDLICMIIFFAVLIWFLIYTGKLKKNYF